MMAQPRVYRDDMQCPRCGSNWLPKHGHARGKQTYRCRQCLYNFTPEAKLPQQSEKFRNMATAIFAEGSSMAAISRVMGIKAETVYSWVKKAAWARELLRMLVRQRGQRLLGQAPPRVISFDEMWSCVGARRPECWVWTAVIEESDGRRWVDFGVGDRSEDTLLRLYGRLLEAERYVSDAYRVYDWLPCNRHVVGKGLEASRNEGLHSQWRDKLNG